MHKSISRFIAFALAYVAIAVCSLGAYAAPVMYVVSTVASDVNGLTSQRLELTLQQWRTQSESLSAAVRSDMRADGHGFIFAALPKTGAEYSDNYS